MNQKQIVTDFIRKPVFAEFSKASLIPETNK